MTTHSAIAPQAEEYAPYYGRYISLISTPDIVAHLDKKPTQLQAMLSGVSEEQAKFQYAPGKWSIKQVLGHVIDTERIMSYRALRISRGDQTPIEGFEQDVYVRDGPFQHSRMSDLLDDFVAVRAATVTLFRNLGPDDWNRRGTAAGNPVSVRALAYIIAGHERHHCNVLGEKYRPGSK